MKIKGKAIVLTNGVYNTKSAKTAHGLVRGSSRFDILGIIDNKFYDNDAGKLLDGKYRNIPIYETLSSFLNLNINIDYCIIGVASAGGVLPEKMRSDIILSLKNNISIINGLHSFLEDDHEFSKIAKTNNIKIHDIRKSRERSLLSFWSGKINQVKCPKIVVMGTDCGLGKRTTAKLIVESLRTNSYKAEMIYTGQTGWMQGWKYGFILDSTHNDFVSGELEKMIFDCYKIENPDFILIEGQAALRNPSGPCGSEFLISCDVDAVVLQHSTKREYFDGWKDVGCKMPSLKSEVELINMYGKQVVGISLNTSGMTDDEKIKTKKDLNKELKIPIVLPIEDGVDDLMPNILKLKKKYDN